MCISNILFEKMFFMIRIIRKRDYLVCFGHLVQSDYFVISFSHLFIVHVSFTHPFTSSFIQSSIDFICKY